MQPHLGAPPCLVNGRGTSFGLDLAHLSTCEAYKYGDLVRDRTIRTRWDYNEYRKADGRLYGVLCIQ